MVGERMFLRKIFGKKPEAPQLRAKRLSISSLKEQILKLKQERLAETSSKLNDVLGRLSEERNTFLNELKNLSEAEAAEGVYPALYKSAIEARRLLVDKLTRSLIKFQPQAEISTDMLTSLDEKLTKMVNFTTHAITTHGRYVRMVFGSRMNALQLRLRYLHGLVKEAHALIEEALKKTRSLDSLLSKVESQMELLHRIDAMRDESESMRGRITELEKSIENENTKLARLMESEEFKRAGSLRDEIQRIEQEITRMRDAIASTLSSIGRPLRKMEKLVTSGKYEMNRELEIVLKLCTRDPLAIISSDEKVSAAQSLLQRMSSLLEEGKINLSERDRAKRIEMVREIVREERLAKFKKRLEQLRGEKEERLRVWEQLPHLRKSELEQAIEKYRAEMKAMQTRIAELDDGLKSAREEADKNRSDLEQLASEVMGTKIEIIS
jgi:chromosome segregation ATPase